MGTWLVRAGVVDTSGKPKEQDPKPTPIPNWPLLEPGLGICTCPKKGEVSAGKLNLCNCKEQVGKAKRVVWISAWISAGSSSLGTVLRRSGSENSLEGCGPHGINQFQAVGLAQTVAKSHNSNTLSWQKRIQENLGEKKHHSSKM